MMVEESDLSPEEATTIKKIWRMARSLARRNIFITMENKGDYNGLLEEFFANQEGDETGVIEYHEIDYRDSDDEPVRVHTDQTDVQSGQQK